MRLRGKNAGDLLLEIYGPQIGKSYARHGADEGVSHVTPSITVKVYGSGTVKLESNTTKAFSDPSMSGHVGMEPVPDEDGWTSLQDEISSSKSASITLTPAAFFVLRVTVVTAGTGNVVVSPEWN